jgi:predicted nucleic acid-binding protein
LNRIVLDASVSAAWCFDDEVTEPARKLLEQSEETQFIVPFIWPVEMTNVLLVNERKARITQADTARFLALVAELSIEVDVQEPLLFMRAVLPLGRVHNLSGYDTAYLELALRLGVSIATLDRKLKSAAEATGVPLAIDVG